LKWGNVQFNRDVSRYFGCDIAKKLYEVLQDGEKKTFLDILESLECEGKNEEQNKK